MGEKFLPTCTSMQAADKGKRKKKKKGKGNHDNSSNLAENGPIGYIDMRIDRWMDC